jgi:hypothetical protein
MKEALTAHCHRALNQWDRALPMVLFAMRSSIGPDGQSAALLTFGEEISIPAAMITPTTTLPEHPPSEFLDQLMNHQREIQQFFLEKHAENRPLTLPSPNHFPHEWVWLQDPILRGAFRPKFVGPYKVLRYQHPVVTIMRDGKEACRALLAWFHYFESGQLVMMNPMQQADMLTRFSRIADRLAA